MNNRERIIGRNRGLNREGRAFPGLRRTHRPDVADGKGEGPGDEHPETLR